MRNRNRKKIIVGMVITIFLPLLMTNTVQALDQESIINFFQENKDFFKNNSIIYDALNILGWGLVEILKYICDGVENLYLNTIGLLDFTTYEPINDFMNSLVDVFKVLLVLSLTFFGITMMLGKEKIPNILHSIMLSAVAIAGTTYILGVLNQTIIGFGNDVLSEESSSDTIIASNLFDLKYINSTIGIENFDSSDTELLASLHCPASSLEVDMIDVNETMNYANFSGSFKDILKYRMIKEPTEDGGYTYQLAEIYNGFGWNSGDDADWFNEFYYRYKVNYFNIYLSLIAFIIVYIALSYKVMRIIYEIAVQRVIAMLYSADITGMQKTIKIFGAIKDSYIVIILTVILIKLFQFMQEFLAHKFEGHPFTYAILFLFTAFAVADGPNIIQQLTGIDAGLSSGLGKMMAASHLAGAAANALKAPIAFARQQHQHHQLLNAMKGSNRSSNGSSGQNQVNSNISSNNNGDMNKDINNGLNSNKSQFNDTNAKQNNGQQNSIEQGQTNSGQEQNNLHQGNEYTNASDAQTQNSDQNMVSDNLNSVNENGLSGNEMTGIENEGNLEHFDHTDLNKGMEQMNQDLYGNSTLANDNNISNVESSEMNSEPNVNMDSNNNLDSNNTVEPHNNLESGKNSEPNKNSESGKNSEPNKNSAPKQNLEPNKNMEANKNSAPKQNLNSGKQLDQNKNLNSGKNLNPSRNLEQNKNIDSGKSLASKQNLEQSKNIDSGKSLGSNNNLEQSKNIDSGKNLESKQNLEQSKNIDSGKSLDLNNNLDSNKSLELNKNLEPNQSLDSNNTVNGTGGKDIPSNLHNAEDVSSMSNGMGTDGYTTEPSKMESNNTNKGNGEADITTSSADATLNAEDSSVTTYTTLVSDETETEPTGSNDKARFEAMEAKVSEELNLKNK